MPTTDLPSTEQAISFHAPLHAFTAQLPYTDSRRRLIYTKPGSKKGGPLPQTAEKARGFPYFSVVGCEAVSSGPG